MNVRPTLLILLFLTCVTTSFQCNKCTMNDIYVNGTKSWVPLRGTTPIAFIDDLGAVTNFSIHGLDTTVVNTTECGDTYKYQYLTNTLYLNAAKTDSIYFNLFNIANLEGRAISNNTFAFSMWDVLGKAKQGTQAKNLTRFTVNNKTFNDVILIFRSELSSAPIDSVMIANNMGIVSFHYFGRRYARQ